MLKICTASAVAAVFATCSVGQADLTGNYSNDFSTPNTPWPTYLGNHHGTSFITNYNGESDLQLVSDGAPGTQGTWDAGSYHFAGKSITSFSASFDFSFNTNGNGGLGDGFSFLFGNMTDMTGNRWQGGEGGVNAMYQDGQGMAIGFDTYGGDSVKANWGSQTIAESITIGTEWWDYANKGSYDNALVDQGNIIVNWSIDLGLQVLIDWGGDPIDGYWTAIETGFFTWPGGYDMTDWSFGFAGRNGGIDNDILIDNLDIAYTYVPSPGAMALLGMGALMGTRRRRH
jgi:hypothetical protein